MNLEVSRLPEHYDRDKWGAEIRPIVDLVLRARRRVRVDEFHPRYQSRRDGRRRPTRFEPAATVCYVLEGLIGRSRVLREVGEQEHYLFEVVNVLRWKRIEINAGVGEGLTDGSNPFVAKAILGFRSP